MSENTEQTVVRGRFSSNVVAVAALAAIAISGWFVWQQIADAQKAPGRSFQRSSDGRSKQLSQVVPSKPNFDMVQATIPVEQIRAGGPPKDGIPALTDAEFVSAAAAMFLSPDDQVIGIAVAGLTKAYPLKILDRHEAVNDRLGDKSFTVTYCPLCDSSAVFDRVYGDQEYEFGISGLLYNSNVLLYDRAAEGSESLWSQMASSSVVGEKSGQSLRRLPLEVTTWEDWRTRHPNTEVLSENTGHQRSYRGRAYKRYFAEKGLMFPVEPLDQRLEAKTPVLGIASPNSQRAYPLASFAAAEQPRVEDQLDGLELTLIYDSQHKSLRVEQADEGLEWVYAFWFAWAAFYPETDIYQTRE